MRNKLQRIAMLVALCVAMGGSAFATGETSCDALNTTGATPTISDAVKCMLDTVAPTTVLVTIVTLFVPILLIIWGARGGFALCATVVKRMFGFLTSRG